MVSDVELDRTTETIKFLCSYGGKILLRPVDGEIRYIGGHTRILAVNRSISFAELMVKLGEFCGYSVELRCQLPNGNLEMLVSIKSDEELALLVAEYDLCCPGSKIRAVLSPPKSLKTVSPPPSTPASVDFYPVKSPFNPFNYQRSGKYSSPIRYPIGVFKDSGRIYYNPFHGQGGLGVRCRDLCCNGQGNPRLRCCGPFYNKNWH
ncbi:hypothetical protein P3X46_023426 [Hevea brasiliensis]|uniref:Uncharacterized protein n=2 Tax=Hevea brasiliensis TaxID=3981 RepID=A0ABQ9LED1_HEVBR|nr:uncharacterized protein LOC110661049 [Hevea brasiliensis]KAF2293273.1 hypothetical protein GH714_040647 [Hevea brasiliensis]KAJ9163795.1 hypothetical protein P3X46_023426 [Hevea brasiliensis]